jgi:hypothetical protein
LTQVDHEARGLALHPAPGRRAGEVPPPPRR